jgi:hypothetical protein
MRRQWSKLPLHVLEQRSKWNSLQLYMILFLMAMLAAMSGFFLASPHSKAPKEGVRLPGMHMRGERW